MNRAVNVPVVEDIAIEIEEVTPSRETRKLKTEAEYNYDNESIVTESEGTISHHMCITLLHEALIFSTSSIVDSDHE